MDRLREQDSGWAAGHHQGPRCWLSSHRLPEKDGVAYERCAYTWTGGTVCGTRVGRRRKEG